MTVFEALLAVQDHDTALDRIRHQRDRLPERARRTVLQERAAAVATELASLRAILESAEQRQTALEADVAVIEHRIHDIEAKMYSGEISATRDLLAMTAEIEALKSRRSSVEDEAIVSIEEAEPVAAAIATLELEKQVVSQELNAVGSTIGEAEADLDGQAEVEKAARLQAAQGVPDELLATYEKLRSSLGGVGAARLVGTSCSGCHLTLPASEVARLKREPPEALALCEQCGRILVR